jgi:hypothetical protein
LDVKWWKRDCLAASLWWRPALTLSTVLVCCLSCLVNMQVCCCFHGLANSDLRKWSCCSLGSLIVQFSQIVAFFTGQSLYSNENPSSWSHSNPLWGEVLPLFLNKVLCRMRTSFLRTMPFHTWSYQSLGTFQVLAVTNKDSVLPVGLFE